MMQEGAAERYIAELMEETRKSLEAEYDSAVNEVMIAMDMTTETGPGKELHDWFTKEKDTNITAALDKIGFEKIELHKAKDVLVELMSKRIPGAEEANG